MPRVTQLIASIHRMANPPKASAAPRVEREQRNLPDRRRRIWWSIWYGSFRPRRRTPPRRYQDSRFHSLDWHAAHLMAVAIGILLLSVVDAFLTLVLLSGGADEVNPIMAALLYKSVAMFAVLKLAMTSVGVVLMVMLARYRFMRLVRVDVVMYCVLIGYASLIGYEMRMLQDLGYPVFL